MYLRQNSQVIDFHVHISVIMHSFRVNSNKISRAYRSYFNWTQEIIENVLNKKNVSKKCKNLRLCECDLTEHDSRMFCFFIFEVLLKFYSGSRLKVSSHRVRTWDTVVFLTSTLSARMS